MEESVVIIDYEMNSNVNSLNPEITQNADRCTNAFDDFRDRKNIDSGVSDSNLPVEDLVTLSPHCSTSSSVGYLQFRPTSPANANNVISYASGNNGGGAQVFSTSIPQFLKR